MRFQRSHKFTKARLIGWAVPLALMVGVGVMGAVRGGQSGSDIAWSLNATQAWQYARQTHRPLLLQFHAQGCEWCAKMEAETFADPRVQELSRRFVCLRIDGEMEPELAQQYGIHEYPTTLFADADDHVLGRLPGYIPPEQFIQLQQKALVVMH